MPDASSLAPPLARQIAGWAASLRYEDLPAAAVAAAKASILDTLAVAWAGAAADGVAGMHALFAERGGRPEAAVWALGGRLPAPAAARMNGMTAAALDFDSLHDGATVHADIVVLPAVLALAEREAADGRTVIAAHVAGAELLVRLGLAMQASPGWFYTSVLGAFGAAAAASRVLGLDADATANALGIALCHAGGTQQSHVEKALTKRLSSAFVAEAGVEAALLAQRGITGPMGSLDGPFGLAGLYAGVDARVVLDGLGRDWLATEMTLKKYPCCFCSFAVIEATAALVAQHGIGPADVAGIEVTISPFMARLVGSPFAPGANPQVAAQFSAQYAAACTILRRRLGVADIEPAAVLDPAIAALTARTRVTVDPAREGRFGPATVTVRTTAGATLTESCNRIPGTPAAPLSEAERLAKACACLAHGPAALPPAKIETLIGRIDRLETMTDARQLLDGLAAEGDSAA